MKNKNEAHNFGIEACMSHFDELHVNENVKIDLNIKGCDNINLVSAINRIV